MISPVTFSKDVVAVFVTRERDVGEHGLFEAYKSLMCSQESERLGRFRSSKAANQFLIGRALLKTSLSHYRAETRPEQWRFSFNKHGKPSICPSLAGPALQFNLSHTDGMIVLAVASAEVGVDVESCRRPGETLTLIHEVFSKAEIEEISRLPVEQQRIRFFELWTLKEAYIKARGAGFALPTNQFSFKFEGEHALTIAFHGAIVDTPGHWRFWQFALEESYALGLALRHAAPRHATRLCFYETIPLLSLSAGHVEPVWFSHQLPEPLSQMTSDDGPPIQGCGAYSDLAALT